jgi:hypothetical protein
MASGSMPLFLKLTVPKGPIRCIVRGVTECAKSSNGGWVMKVKDVMHKGVDWVSPDTTCHSRN